MSKKSKEPSGRAAEEILSAALEQCPALVREYVAALEKAVLAKGSTPCSESVPKKAAAQKRVPRKEKNLDQVDRAELLRCFHNQLFGEKPETSG